MRWRLGGALAASTIAAAACWALPRRDVRREPGLSVLLITVDTLRADALGAHGNSRAATPWMDRLAAEGVRFDQAHAHNVVTLPSHANILSGRHPADHGIRDNSGFRFPNRMETLATLLQAHGYRTAAFVSAFPLDSRFGLGRGFEVYDDAFVDAEARPAFLEQERRGEETVALARRWLEGIAGRPFFCWVHLYEPHFPYAPVEPFASRFRDDPYHGEVAATDAALGPLLEPLVAASDRSRTLVVLTSDHGESLGEHGEATHGILAYEATLRVPLILHQPRLFRPRIVAEPARHVDLLPTILDALALPVPEGLPGRSLLEAAAGRSTVPVTTYFEALSGRLNRGWAPLRGVIRGGMKYVDLPVPELYDLGRDPAESRNLAAPQPQRLEELRALLAPFGPAGAEVRPHVETAEIRERLRSLGYLEAGPGPPKERYTEEDDPKRLIALDTMLHDVVGLHLAGDLRGALERCRELVRLRPQMPMSLLHLAHLERESGNLDAGVEALRRALALNPDDVVTASLLGAYLTQAGRAREAAALLEPWARRQEPDVDVLTTRALALARLARTEEAVATLRRAHEADPSNAMVSVTLGTVHLMAGRREAAREAFEAALALNPNVSRAWSSLAMIAAEDGQVPDALERWRRAVRLDPREHEKLLALSLLLSRQGRSAEAGSYLELFVTSAPPSRFGKEIERARGWLAAPGRRG